MTPPALHPGVVCHVSDMLADWSWYSKLSYTTYGALLAASLIAGALTVQYAGDAAKAWLVGAAAIVAFVATELLNTIDLHGLGTAFRDAWRDVTVAKRKYDLKPQRIADKRRLVRAYRQGEDTIRRGRWWKDNPPKAPDAEPRQAGSNGRVEVT